MTTANDARKAHKILDDLLKGKPVLDEEREFLRSALPEPPKQKTLEEITEHVRNAWVGARGNEWGGNSYNPDIAIEDWLAELYVQMNGLKDAPATVPALPAGMRIADHAVYGHVVTSPKPDQDGVYVLLVPRPKVETGADWEYAHKCELTFIDAEPAKPAHPEFLETEADYASVPRGTVAAKDGWLAWLKETDGAWSYGGGSEGEASLAQSGKRRVLRWGWGE